MKIYTHFLLIQLFSCMLMSQTLSPLWAMYHGGEDRTERTHPDASHAQAAAVSASAAAAAATTAALEIAQKNTDEKGRGGQRKHPDHINDNAEGAPGEPEQKRQRLLDESSQDVNQTEHHPHPREHAGRHAEAHTSIKTLDPSEYSGHHATKVTKVADAPAPGIVALGAISKTGAPAAVRATVSGTVVGKTVVAFTAPAASPHKAAGNDQGFATPIPPPTTLSATTPSAHAPLASLIPLTVRDSFVAFHQNTLPILSNTLSQRCNQIKKDYAQETYYGETINENPPILTPQQHAHCAGLIQQAKNCAFSTILHFESFIRFLNLNPAVYRPLLTHLNPTISILTPISDEACHIEGVFQQTFAYLCSKKVQAHGQPHPRYQMDVATTRAQNMVQKLTQASAHLNELASAIWFSSLTSPMLYTHDEAKLFVHEKLCTLSQDFSTLTGHIQCFAAHLTHLLKTKEPKPLFASLPDEMIAYIAGFLSYTDLKRWRLAQPRLRYVLGRLLMTQSRLNIHDKKESPPFDHERLHNFLKTGPAAWLSEIALTSERRITIDTLLWILGKPDVRAYTHLTLRGRKVSKALRLRCDYRFEVVQQADAQYHPLTFPHVTHLTIDLRNDLNNDLRAMAFMFPNLSVLNLFCSGEGFDSSVFNWLVNPASDSGLALKELCIHVQNDLMEQMHAFLPPLRHNTTLETLRFHYDSDFLEHGADETPERLWLTLLQDLSWAKNLRLVTQGYDEKSRACLQFHRDPKIFKTNLRLKRHEEDISVFNAAFYAASQRLEFFCLKDDFSEGPPVLCYANEDITGESVSMAALSPQLQIFEFYNHAGPNIPGLDALLQSTETYIQNLQNAAPDHWARLRSYWGEAEPKAWSQLKRLTINTYSESYDDETQPFVVMEQDLKALGMRFGEQFEALSIPVHWNALTADNLRYFRKLKKLSLFEVQCPEDMLSSNQFYTIWQDKLTEINQMLPRLTRCFIFLHAPTQIKKQLKQEFETRFEALELR